MQIPFELTCLCDAFHRGGGRPYLVGGCVRDSLLGREVKDWDMEIFGLPESEVSLIAASQGRVNAVGKSFGVLKLTTGSGEDYDIALPRREVKSGEGHKGFEVEVDPSLSLAEAAERRDFTMNAIYYDPIAKGFADPSGGVRDLAERILRPVSERFKEDPLRVLRGFQFAGRFGMEGHPEFFRMAKEVHGSFSELPAERVYGEFEKWASKSRFPSKGLKVLEESSWITHFPEIDALRGVEQNPKWHPEGDVYVHTVQCVDELAKNPKFRKRPDRDRIFLMLAMLGHDFGKPSTTRHLLMEDGSQKITAHGHEAAGVEPFRTFLKRMKAPGYVFQKGAPIVKEHLVHANFKESPPSDKAVLRLSKRLRSTSIEDLALVMQADLDGRPPLPKTKGPGIQNLLMAARSLGVAEKAPAPFIQGRDLLELGFQAGPGMGAKLKELENRQLNGEFSTREDALKALVSENRRLPSDPVTKEAGRKERLLAPSHSPEMDL